MKTSNVHHNGAGQGAVGFLRYHWFDVGTVLAAGVGVYLLLARPAGLVLLLWLALAATFVHQFEEYRIPGYFPGMFNTVMFSSKQPDRFPLNASTALVVNLTVGWLAYFLGAALNLTALWLGIALMFAAFGQFIIHGLVFNIRGRMPYNPGMFTSIVLYLPIAAYFFYLVITTGAASPLDWVLGVVVGVALAYFGILKTVDWLKDENTPYVFPARFLMPARRRAAEESGVNPKVAATSATDSCPQNGQADIKHFSIIGDGNVLCLPDGA